MNRVSISGALNALVVLSVFVVLLGSSKSAVSTGPVEITLTNPGRPGLRLRVDPAYMPSTFLRMVAKNRKGGEHEKAMLDVSYPSMKPVSSEDAKSDTWKTIVFLANSHDGFVSRYFETTKGSRFKRQTNVLGPLEKYVLSDMANLGPNIKKVWSHYQIYYHRNEAGNGPEHLIFCQYSNRPNSRCAAYSQLESGLIIEYLIPYTRLSDWRDVLTRFRRFAKALEVPKEQ